MKVKVLAVMLLCLLWTGCGAKEETQEMSKVSQPQSTVEETETSREQSHQAASQEEPSASASEPEDTQESAYVLSFESTTTEGESITSDCFEDSKLTMINVWGTYCNPCLMEMPDLGEIAASYDKADFQMLGVVCDVTEDADAKDIDYAKSLIEDTGADYVHVLLSESLYTNLVGGTDAVPTTFFVNQKGEVLGYVVGANSKEYWTSLIESLLAEGV